ncbi:acetoacetate decarboxylase family protein [Natrinema hispanicum]|uniref:Acetoacetate decarboxylase (ADC) n=1 Tax=Natrinema hispanicum TaxID=392421 RepID=A0A1I0AED7_9EURY|nr:acetoacetate decarboxylase family protein [Natrinema hispanicum]SDB97834.1 Acetoacetate decarboxylase (ADC) [Natrinema hispanicum]SES92550.1 Acetoacetate decarboxylase (ADC) [Natrinema hispanicum]
MTTSDHRSRTRLSTGHEISLPLALSLAMGGVVVPARRSRLEAILPDALSSLAVAPGVGCVALVAIQYHRVGGDDRDTTGLEPYDEFAVIIPAVHGSRTNTPIAPLAGGEIGGCVHWLPVTTEPAVALGREIWGYPKERTDVTVTDGPDGVRAVVAGGRDGDRETVRLEVARPRTSVRARDWTLASYTTKAGALVRTPVQVQGDVAIGIGPSVGTRLEVAPALARELGLWQRPVGRLYGSRVRARLLEGEWITE